MKTSGMLIAIVAFNAGVAFGDIIIYTESCKMQTPITAIVVAVAVSALAYATVRLVAWLTRST